MSIAPGLDEIARWSRPVVSDSMLGIASSGMRTCLRRTSVAVLGLARSLSRHASISTGSRLLVGEPGALASIEVALASVARLRVFSAILLYYPFGMVASGFFGGMFC